jgi:GT2 family glycosyltransferase
MPEKTAYHTPLVSVIVLNWNQPDYTLACVRSVLTQKLPQGDFEIFLVDNGSSDDSWKRFQDMFGNKEKVRMIQTGKNLGYTGGNNIAAKESQAKYVVILNNDTEVHANWLSALVEAIESDKNIGAVNSYEIREGKKVPLETHVKFEFPMNVLQYGVKVACKQKRDLKKLKSGELIEVSAIKGCSFIYKRELSPLPFDDDYFIYAEETKLSWQLRSKGYKIMFAPLSVVDHYHNIVRKSSKSFSKFAVYLGERNRTMNLLTFYQPWTTLKMLPFMAGQMLVSNILEPRKIPYRFKAYAMLLASPRKIWRKRKEIQGNRTVGDKELLSHGWTFTPRASEEYK